MGDIHEDDVWVLIKSMFKHTSLVAHQIDSYNHAIEFTIPAMLSSMSQVSYCGWNITFKKPKFLAPTQTEINKLTHPLTPSECIMRNIPYVSEMLTDITIISPAGERIDYKNRLLAKIPVMVRSCLCNITKLTHTPEEEAKLNHDIMDCGGYFIIFGTSMKGGGGGKKIINFTEKSLANRCIVFGNRKSSPKYSVYVENRSMALNGRYLSAIQIGFLTKRIYVTISHMPTEGIPLGIIFAALGITSVKKIAKLCVWDGDLEMMNLILPSIEESYTIFSMEDPQEEALMYIGMRAKKKLAKILQPKEEVDEIAQVEEVDEIEAAEAAELAELAENENTLSYAKYLINNDLLPHLGITAEAYTLKSIYLGYAVRKLLLAHMKKIPFHDRDHYANKRISSAGLAVSTQFFYGMKKIISDLKNEIKKEHAKSELKIHSRSDPKILHMIKSTTITQNFIKLLNSSSKKGGVSGTAQVLGTLNYNDPITMSRKLYVDLGDSGKILGPRQVHSSQFGGVCVFETPESKKVGTVKPLAISAKITLGSDCNAMIELIKGLSNDDVKLLKPLSTRLNTKRTIVFVNGILIGTTAYPHELISQLKKMRRCGDISYEVGICFKSNEINVNCDAGRIIRPLLIVENGKLLITKKFINEIYASQNWQRVITSGYVEYLDKEEEDTEFIYIAETFDKLYQLGDNVNKLSHCEIHPSLWFGFSTALIPFSDHNQAPRNAYMASMLKQTVGIPSLNIRSTIGNKFAFSLNYPQKQISQTRLSVITKSDVYPSGQNAYVILGNMLGFGQEDSLVFNMSSCQRGFMCCTKYTSYTMTYLSQQERCVITPSMINKDGKSTKVKFIGNPGKLSKHGVVPPGIFVEKNDILISKINHTKDGIMDASIRYEELLPARVDSVDIYTNGDGFESVRVILAQYRPPGIGYKSLCTSRSMIPDDDGVYTCTPDTSHIRSGGDKFACSAAQKGTLGVLMNQEDLPFDSKGISPDIIINSLAIPSRMTIGTLVEAIAGKALCSSSYLNTRPVNKIFTRPLHTSVTSELLGSDCVDATPFTHQFELEKIVQELKANGVNGFGIEKLRDGQTGEEHEYLSFSGIVYYHRLKHMVIDKIHSRSTGSIATLTRQPREGRQQNGGFRVGRMETAACAAAGAPSTIEDRLFINSDYYEHWICNNCGLAAIVNEAHSMKTCNVCNTSDVKLVKVPYGALLLTMELAGANVVTTFKTE